MDAARARELVDAERARVMELLAAATGSTVDDVRAAIEAGGGDTDIAQPLEHAGVDKAIVASLDDRLEALERADRRILDGTYGRSVLSGAPISDARLEAEPAAEYTTEEAARLPHRHRRPRRAFDQ